MAFALVGSRLAHYEVLAALGAGAMSEVYRCQDTRLDREVAVKVIHETVASRAHVVERFEREARTAARIEHPHVARVHYSGSHEGMPFYAMELVEGWPLGTILETRVPFSWEHLLALFAQIASGLQAAIDLGVVHGDVKPANVIVGRSGSAKIVDFGLARLTSEPSRAGRMLGTPYYMAPEVICGEVGDHRSDLYSLGASLFHFLSGRPPFDAETPAALIEKHVVEPAPYLRDLNPDYPQRLSSLAAQLMAKEPQDRPPSYREVALRLQRTREEMSPEQLSTALTWCGRCECNTEGSDNQCTRCGDNYGTRERPEWFHVDLVGWLRNNAEEEVAAYVSGALGVDVQQIHGLLRPLPYRAAFRLNRERARRIQRRFYDLGADVSLVPVETGTGAAAREQLRALPFKPVWPPAPAVPASRALGRSTIGTGEWGQTTQKTSPGASIILGTVALALAGVLLLEHNALQTERRHVDALEAQLRAVTAKTTGPAPSEPRVGGDTAQVPAESHKGEPTIPPGHTWTVAPETDGEAEGPLASEDPDAAVEKTAPVPSARPLRSTWFSVTDQARLGPNRTQKIASILDREARVIDRQIGLASSLATPVRLIESTESGAHAGPLRRQLAYRPEITIAIDPADPEERLVSMVQYQLTRAAVDLQSSQRAPDFLREGLALYLEQGAPTSAEVTALVTEAPRPIAAEPDSGNSTETRQEALRAFVAYLVNSRGMDAIRDVLARLNKGQDVGGAFEAAMGAAPSELQAEWLLANGLE
ncbi:MAG: hypothetical protein CL928_09385 [Deltaproteobacteria bacterium]|nr:hypothetical protein [Deltaproteobacteria bacterium]